MSFLDKLKKQLGLGDISAISKLKDEEADIYKAKEKVAKEELEANEALLEWSNNEDNDELKKAVEKYYEKKKEIIDAYRKMIDDIKEEYLLPIEKISHKVEILNEVIDEQEKIEKKLEKAKKNLEKREFDLEKETSKSEHKVDKIRKKEIAVEKAKSELEELQNSLENLNDRVSEMRKEVTAFKFATLKAGLIKLNEHEKTYMEIAKEIFPLRDALINSIPGEPATEPSEPKADAEVQPEEPTNE
ncbi:MAG: hypothetical protein ACTSVE_15235 [Candidatus Helarchaeota archaeon]